MSARAAGIRLGRLVEGVVVAVLGGALLVGGATWVEGGAPGEAVVVWVRLLGAMLVLGGTLGSGRARARGDVAALASMGGGPMAWGLAGACVGMAVGAAAGALGVGWVSGEGWRWVTPVDGAPGAWWLDGRPLVGPVPAELSTRLCAGFAEGVRGALACTLGVYVGLHVRRVGRALALTAAAAMAVTLAG